MESPPRHYDRTTQVARKVVGGGGIMHICQYKIKGSVLPGMLFHDLFEAKVLQQATDIQTIEIAGYQDTTVGIF